jgi:hypothetical protein
MANHPVYDHIKNGGYDDVTQAAKLARAWLKKEFPGIKFSVRSDKYAGGSSMRVAWEDGPTDAEVAAVVAPLEGKGFDGSIDYAYFKTTWLNPDGSAARAVNRGSDVCGGQYEREEYDAPHPDAIKVCFGCYVFCERSYSIEFLQRQLDRRAAEWSDELTDAIKSGKVYVHEGGWIDGAGSIWMNGPQTWADQVLYRERHQEAV